MAESLYDREDAVRCGRPARDSTDPNLSAGFPGLVAEVYTTMADDQVGGTAAVWQPAALG